MKNVDQWGNIEMKRLKPCPFCGCKEIYIHEFSESIYSAFCNHCGTSAPKDSINPDGAKRIWNRRRYPTADMLK